MNCPKCGTMNADGVQFCTNCHATLFFKCPKCEHMQSHNDVCEKCGTNFAAFWSGYLQQEFQGQEQLDHDKLRAEGVAALQAATLPFSASRGLSRFLLFQIIGRAVSFFRAR
jgi:RNA polymerase subunit RPABC4/transcription elongation factor Spt4